MSDEINYKQQGKFPRDLPVQLNETELDKYGELLAVAVREVALLEEKKKQDAAKWANQIKAKNLEVKRLADARAKGEELRPVMCAERLVGNVVNIIRLDTGGVVDSRPADLQDLQTTIPGTDSQPGERSTSTGKVISLVPPIDEGEPVDPSTSTIEGADETMDGEPGENTHVGVFDGETDTPPVSDTGDMLESAASSEAGTPVESSTGDAVFVGSDLLCPRCGEAITDDDEREEAEGCVVHTRCLDSNAGGASDGAFGAPQEARAPSTTKTYTLSNGMTVKIDDQVQAKAKAKRERSSRKNSDKSKGKNK